MGRLPRFKSKSAEALSFVVIVLGFAFPLVFLYLIPDLDGRVFAGIFALSAAVAIAVEVLVLLDWSGR